jgi:O-antigen/teichoic acid export membrane protein
LWFAFLSWPAQEFIRRAFYARGEIHKAALNSFISNALRFAYLIWMGSRGLVDGHIGLNAIAWGALMALVVGLWGARRYFSGKITRPEISQTWKENWQVGRWVTGALLSHWVSLEVYPLVVAGMISFAATGAYRALENLVAAVHVILRAMDTFITPYAARSFSKEGVGKLLKTLRWAYLFGGIPIVGILVLALIFTEPLLRLLYEDAYLFMSEGILWLVLFYFLWFTYWPVQSVLKAIKHTRPLFNANLIAIICMFTLGFLAVNKWGVNGAYIGQGLNALITNIILWRAWLKLWKGGL